MSKIAQVFSLAELAAESTDEIAVLMSRIPDAGVFVVNGLSVALTERESQDPEKPNLFNITWKAQILIAEPLNKDIDPESKVGKEITYSATLWPSDMAQGIGLVKGEYKKIGLDFSGNMGGIEGTPGWLDNIVNHKFKWRIRHGKNKAGADVAYFDWLPFESADSDEQKAA